MVSVHAFSFSVVVLAVLAAAATDVWKFRIYNALTLPLILTGGLYHVVTGGIEGLAASVLGVIIGTALLIPLYVRGGMGAGDVKLTAGIGAWLGAWHVLHVLIVAGLAMGAYSAGIAVWNRFGRTHIPVDPAMDIATVMQEDAPHRHLVPFGAMLALGVVVTILWIGGD